jgi:hypothetical protein
VVVPSLPGYTVSFRSNRPRLGIVEIADLFACLMTDVLGYRRFAALEEPEALGVDMRAFFRELQP